MCNTVGWKTRGAECGKCGVWKMRRKFQFSISISIFHFKCVETLLTIKKETKRKKRDESLHFKMRRAGMVICVVVFTNAPVLLSLSTTRPVFKENGSILNSYIHNIVEWLALNHFKCNTLALWY